MELLLSFGLIGLLAAASAYLTRSWRFSQFSDIPWAGVRKEAFSTTRASFRQLTGSLKTLADGYNKFSKLGKPFVIPDPSFQPQVFLPREQIKWLTEQPDSVLSRWAVRGERNALRYLPIDVDQPSTIAFIDKVIGHCLTRKLDNIQPDVCNGIRESVDANLGIDNDSWHQVNLQATLSKIVDRTVTGAFFGSPLCHDELYLRDLSRYIMFMGVGTLIIGQLPRLLVRPFFASLINIPLRVYKAKVLKVLVPVIEERMQDLEGKTGEQDEPKDFVTQGIKFILKSKDRTYINNPHYLAEQLLLLNFAALGSTAAGGTNAFLDLLSADPKLDLYNCLREEAADAFRSEADWAEPAALKRLVCTDSAMRESFRRNPIQIRGLMREAMPKDGLTLPDGSKVPQGTWIGVPIQAVQMDDRFYSKPDGYDPFRFARMKEFGGDPGNIDAAHTSDTYLFFSHSRSACPGRWFATRILKLLIAYVTLNYDIQPMDKRAPNFIFGDANIPNLFANIKVRRRKHT